MDKLLDLLFDLWDFIWDYVSNVAFGFTIAMVFVYVSRLFDADLEMLLVVEMLLVLKPLGIGITILGSGMSLFISLCKPEDNWKDVVLSTIQGSSFGCGVLLAVWVVEFGLQSLCGC